ncbi:MAG: small basic protein [Planctomycetaceae bacterium]
MTIDKSLKKPSGVVKVRNVLNRYERIAILKDRDRWVSGQSPLGLPKVRVVKAVVGKKEEG